MPQPQTNANSQTIASILTSARQGTFTGLITTKKGEVRGGKTYGDDTVHVVIYTGFKYKNLVQKSLDFLGTLDLQKVLDDANFGMHWAPGVPGLMGSDGEVTLAHMKQARAELITSFENTLDPDKPSTSTTEHVYEPLVVGGEQVRGGRVYHCNAPEGCHCRNCTGNPKAPLPGTIYLQGLKIWSKVLTPAVNGYWKTNSKAKTIAKNLLCRLLPVSKYVSFALEPGGQWLLKAGGAAIIEAKERGFVITEDLR